MMIANPGQFSRAVSTPRLGRPLSRTGTASSQVGVMPGPSTGPSPFHGTRSLHLAGPPSNLNLNLNPYNNNLNLNLNNPLGNLNLSNSAAGGVGALPTPNGWSTVVRGSRGDGPIPAGFGASWVVVGVLGRGVFGDIYHVVDRNTGRPAAVKVELHAAPRRLLRLEAEMMNTLADTYAVPKVIDGGHTNHYEWVAMELVGASLAELRSAMGGAFSPSTALKLAFKALNCLEELHLREVVHGDVKPGNFAMGVADNVGKLYVFDFGLARRFPREEHKANFRGTVKYASLHAHERRNVTARDDLWSWFYMVVEWIKGELPWTPLCLHPDQPRNEVYRVKKDWDSQDFVWGLPAAFDEIRLYLQSLLFNEVPEYDYLYALLAEAHLHMGCDWNAPLDWETEQGELLVHRLKARFGEHPFVPTGGIGRTTILEGGAPGGDASEALFERHQRKRSSRGRRSARKERPRAAQDDADAEYESYDE